MGASHPFNWREEPWTMQCILALITVAALTGCASMNFGWYKPGVSQQEFAQACLDRRVTCEGDEIWADGRVADCAQGREVHFVESIRDPRVGLVLSGHTHGGQVVVPGFGAPIVSSRSGVSERPCA